MPDEQPPDSGDGPEEYASIDEVAAELLRVSSADAGELDRLKVQARILIRGTSMEAGDLFNTAVERLLNGQRHWSRRESLVDCILRTMKSLRRDYWRREQIPLVAECDGAAGLRSEPDPETQFIAHNELEAVLEVLSDDKNTAGVAYDAALGHSPAEIMEKFHLTATDYASALKRIRRALARYEESGGRS